MAMIGRKAAVAEIGAHRHELNGRVAFAAWLGVHAQLLANAGAEIRAFLAWAEEFYVRPGHRSAELLDPSTINTPRIDWKSG
jgi:NADH dehydrogenase